MTRGSARGDRGEIQTDRRRAAAARHPDRVHRRRAPQHRRDPGADGPQPRTRARLRVGDDRCQAVSRPALDRRRRARRRPPTPSSRCPRCSTTGSGRGGSTSRSSAPPRSTARQPQLDRDRRLRPSEDAPARRRRRTRDRGELRRGDRDRAPRQAHVRREARLRDHRRPRRGRAAGYARTPRLPRSRSDRRDHRPRRARARSRDEGARADADPSRDRRGQGPRGRPAGTCK